MRYKLNNRCSQFGIRSSIISVFLLSFFVAYAQDTLSVGAAMRVITPSPLLPVSGGIGMPLKTKASKGELSVRAMVLEKGQTKIAIVGVDNMGWPAALGDKSRELIKHIPADNILIGATHTHSAPDAYGFVDRQGNSSANPEYLSWCVRQIADAVNEAFENRQPAKLKIAVEKARGKIAFNYYADRLYDPRCGVIQAIANKDNRPIITLVNYAIHPEVIGAKQEILTPDLCGPLYDKIESETGSMALFMNSAQGGMVTADNRGEDGKLIRTWGECVRIGELLADEALRIIAKSEVQESPTLYCNIKTIALPVESELMKKILQKQPAIQKEVSGDHLNIITSLNLLNIGTAQIVTVPGEALPNIGYYIKRKMNTIHPFVFGLTNDAYGYIMTKEDYNSFKVYDYITKVCLGEKTGEIYIDKVIELINESPSSEGS